jgi:O-antigen/teichoic acid export membrane protein
VSDANGVGRIQHELTTNVGWSAVAQFFRLGGQLLTTVILARLLPATDFGLIAMAMVVTGFVALFRDLGTSAAVIQRAEPSQALLSSACWLNLVFGFALWMVFASLAPAVATVLAEPRLVNVLQALLVALPITSLGAIPQALLEKASRFRTIALIESASAVIALSGAVWAAWLGWGVFSLVVQALLSALVTTIGCWIRCHWRPSLAWDGAAVSSLLTFGGNLVGFNVFNYLIRNLDNLLVGRYLGATELGYYSMAYRLMLWPLQNISSVVGRALFPLFSRLQTDRGEFSGVYIQATMAVVFVTAPLMCGFFVLRDPLVTVALGSEWRPVADVLAWLIPVGLLQSIGATVGSLYLATGRTDVMFKWGILAGLLIVPAFVVGLQWGITGVAAAYGLASLLLFWPSLAIPYRLVNLRVGDVLYKLAPPLLSAAAMAVVVALVALAWPGGADIQLPRVAGLIVVGVAIYAGLCALFQRRLATALLHAVFRRSP